MSLKGSCSAIELEADYWYPITMQGYVSNIERETLENENFRKVLYTAPHSQLVVMTLRPGEEIGAEVHEEHDQFFRVEAGRGEAVLNESDVHVISDGDVVVVPAGMRHNIINTSSDEVLKLYTIYSPPEHAEGTVHATKDAALRS